MANTLLLNRAPRSLETRSRPRRARARVDLERLTWTLRHRGYPLAKRALDLAVAWSALLLLSPLLALVALAIKLEDGGDVLFARERCGEGGRTFPFYKFRSMAVDAEARRAGVVARNAPSDGIRFKMKADPRVTRVGRWIRRFSVDELPQLWNVIRGDMTLVGPRPPIPEEVARYGPREWHRLDVKPGLTCTWQVSGRATIPFREQVALDVAYIRARSLLGDLRLLLKTVPAVLVGTGAY